MTPPGLKLGLLSTAFPVRAGRRARPALETFNFQHFQTIASHPRPLTLAKTQYVLRRIFLKHFAITLRIIA